MGDKSEFPGGHEDLVEGGLVAVEFIAFLDEPDLGVGLHVRDTHLGYVALGRSGDSGDLEDEAVGDNVS